MWEIMVQEGQFERRNTTAGPGMPSTPGETLCAAVSASTWVEPHSKCTVAFALAWSSPRVKFKKGKTYYRQYTKFYGTSERAAMSIVDDALMNYQLWEEEIERWQKPILEDERLPEWYKFTLFNELYFLVAGGTVWTDGKPPEIDENLSIKCNQEKCRTKIKDFTVTMSANDRNASVNTKVDEIGATRDDCEGERKGMHYGSFVNHDVQINSQNEANGQTAGISKGTNEPVKDDDVGKFLYLEGVEYIMWCTYDVHFYASFALLDLFPKIELNIQRDFAKAVLHEDKRKVKFLSEGNWGIRKVKGAVPHDLGTHDPWHEMNAYNIHDTSRWKDLNPKFVLQVYRDFAATGNMAFAMEVWPAVCTAMEYMQQFDKDGDGLIENDGFPDQTYDAWTVHGISSYCGCLWLAALQAAAAMAERLDQKPFAEKYRIQFHKAKQVFQERLWNGSYFNYDSGASSNSKSIQADQLAGQWYTFASGLPSIFDDSKIRNALQKIFEFNVMKVKGGRIGAVNGMFSSGKVDETCMQSREIWTGVTYAVAATMLHAGMEHQGFVAAEGIFISGWSEEGFGYWFQTPEGWTVDGHYRSLIYMRPLAIWAMQWALSPSKTILEPPKAILEAPKFNIMERDYSSLSSLRAKTEGGVRKKVVKSKWFSNSVFHCEC